MIILPAIDLLNGQCVRLRQGVESTSTVYSAHPEEMAKFWQDQGARYLHVVNLDGAFGRARKNINSIKSILTAVQIPVELGGGIRTLEDAENWLNMGISRVIFGTVAVTRPEIISEAVKIFGPDRVVAGVDARDGRVAIEGWEKVTGQAAVDCTRQMKNRGVERIIYTDVSRDGELSGPNLESTSELASGVGIKVIASGGFSAPEHFERLAALDNNLIEGAIVGKALYEKKIDFRQINAMFTK
ncbi:1-(5-phosphoribosyl)-5-[(5-phosphoribosylamino)methylideneamino]imidazole-4-carboxamide isomerase [candidate division KSB1 bacterium]|nr:1-(5-phosphoribosyl)-5-[(5-phosphoribosylamino)methylideneamino]imidazole-4-carboxamide isomerase [candidate division KSB1 bacterium]